MMLVRNKLLGIALVVFATALLVACDTMSEKLGITESQYDQLTPPQKVFFYSAQHKYARALAVTYKEQPSCGAVFLLACSDEQIVKGLQDADLALESAISIARENPGEEQIALMYTAYATFARLLEQQIIAALIP
jgi:hypothetical protein